MAIKNLRSSKVLSGFILFILFVCFGSAFAAGDIWKTIVISQQSQAEVLATRDLQRYIGQVTGVVPRVIEADVWKNSPVDAILLGKALDLDKDFDLGEEGYFLGDQKKNSVDIIAAAGVTARGNVNAIYGLLREVGFGFYLGGESIPGSLPDKLGSASILRKPVFKVRGSLPWYNFFNSPTAWDAIDHRTFVDQLIRSGANAVTFHSYNCEPFAAFEKDGKMYLGDRIRSSKNEDRWGVNKVAVSEFGFGTDKLFAGDGFGAVSALLDIDDDAAIRLEQDILRDAIDYASKRGLYTCLGFEIYGDPTDPNVRDEFLKRFNYVVDKYPSLDYISLWQREGHGAMGFPNTWAHIEDDSFLKSYAIARRDIFKRAVEEGKGHRDMFLDNEVGKFARATEGARLEQFGMLAYAQLLQRVEGPKLMMAGWGGDGHLMMGAYYPGLDKLLPKDVVFSALTYEKSYDDLDAERQRWPVPWLECDGDMWHPQPVTNWLQGTMKDIKKGGSQGYLTIHWRTREVEESFSALVEQAWRPGLSYEQFYDELAEKYYGKTIAKEMAVLHREMDVMGYRMVGGRGQNECAEFTWGPAIPEKIEQVKGFRSRAIALMDKAGTGKERLGWLINRLGWVLDYYQAELTAVDAQRILVEADKSEDAAKKKELADEAKKLLENSTLARAMRAYAKRVSTRGEYGVLATINTKAYYDWRKMYRQALDILGMAEQDVPAEKWDVEADIILPRFVGSVGQGSDIELAPIVFGGGDAWMHYRKVGEKKWQSIKLADVQGWVKKAVVPADKVNGAGVEFGFSFSSDSGDEMAYGPVCVTVMPALKVNTKADLVIEFADAKGEIELKVQHGLAVPVELSWAAFKGADYYRVYRNGKMIVETAVNYCPDIPDELKLNYYVQAIGGGKVIGESAKIDFVIEERDIEDEVAFELYPNSGGVLIVWGKTESFDIRSYRIYKTGGDSKRELIAAVNADKQKEHLFFDKPSAGSWGYEVVGVNAFGNEGPGVGKVVDFPVAAKDAAIVDLALNSKPEGAVVVGPVEFGDDGAKVSDGYIEVAGGKQLSLGRCKTISFEFKADSLEDMPAVLCNGRWRSDGWFFQILGGTLWFKAPVDDIGIGGIEAGKWYYVKMVFDGLNARLCVNDKWAGPVVINPINSDRKLVIGQYDDKNEMFDFKGCVRNIKIYDDALMENVEAEKSDNPLVEVPITTH